MLQIIGWKIVECNAIPSVYIWFNAEMSDWRCKIMMIMIPLQLSICITVYIWFNAEMSDWRCKIMMIMIPLQLSICITEELFAKYLYCYPDTHGNQITCQLSQKMYCKWYVDWDMHSYDICWQCSGLSTSLPWNFDQYYYLSIFVHFPCWFGICSIW